MTNEPPSSRHRPTRFRRLWRFVLEEIRRRRRRRRPEEVIPRGRPLRFLRLPLGKTGPIFANEALFDPYIREASRTYGVEVPLIKAIIAAESSFNPRAFNPEPSSSGSSYGLMQILTQTARGLGFQGPMEALFEPRANVLLGTKLLRELLQRWKHLDAAVSSYNQGSPRKTGGEFRNQSYVDKVLRWHRQFTLSEQGSVILASSAFALLAAGAVLFLILRDKAA